MSVGCPCGCQLRVRWVTRHAREMRATRGGYSAANNANNPATALCLSRGCAMKITLSCGNSARCCGNSKRGCGNSERGCGNSKRGLWKFQAGLWEFQAGLWKFHAGAVEIPGAAAWIPNAAAVYLPADLHINKARLLGYLRYLQLSTPLWANEMSDGIHA